ncbi:MAG: hypothetical protein Q9188_004727 [Gyalolechia gomerana]
MDIFLGKVTQQAMNYAIRWEIQALGQRLAAAATTDERARNGKLKAQEKAQHDLELKRVIQAIKKLLNKIEDAVPLINLAITASGTSLSSNLPSTVSPSRLLQASTFLTAGDTQYSINSSQPVQIGPTFTLSMYMLFAGHIRPQYEEDIRESTWKEVIHKANVKLMRVSLDVLYDLPGETSRRALSNGSVRGSSTSPSPKLHGDGHPSEGDEQARADEYAYQLLIVEDLEDDRVHTFEDDEPQPGPFGDVNLAGIREALPVHEVSKIFYADTGKILNIGTDGEVNSPILLLKRDPNAVPPRRMMERGGHEGIQGYGSESPYSPMNAAQANGHGNNQSQLARLERASAPASAVSTPRKGTDITPAPNLWRIPQDLDPEWLAFEVYTETPDSDLESEPDAPPTKQNSRTPSLEPNLATSMSRLQVNSPSPSPNPSTAKSQPTKPSSPLPPIRTSLSLLETLLRLLSLQQFQQTTHLSIPDELLTFFLSESASTGAANGDVEERKRRREDARRRVGFDPYDESPIKRRGEEYQYQNQYHGQEGGEEGWTPERMGAANEGGDGGGSGAGYPPGTPQWTSPRYDEGYGTHHFEYPSPSPAYGRSPLLLKGRRSRSGTPLEEKGTPPVRLRGAENGMKRGSPFARPGTGGTDERLGSSKLEDSRSPSGGEGERDLVD